MIRVKSVTIEGMHNVDKKTYTFNDVNYLFGKNGAGKSTVLQAVQLALLGYIPGMNKTKESIFSNSNNHTMAVTLNLIKDNEDISIQRIWNLAGKSINSIVNTCPETLNIEEIVQDLELPVFNFNDFISMTSNKLKDWFIGFLPNSGSEINWIEELSDSTKAINIVDETLIPHWATQIDSYPCKGVDQVRKANQEFKEALSWKKSELQRTEATIKSLVFYSDCDTKQPENDIRAEISNLQAEYRKGIEQLNNLKTNERIANQIADLKVKAEYLDQDEEYISNNKAIEDLKDKMSQKCNELDSIKSNRDDLRAEITKINMEIGATDVTIQKNGICSYTGAICESIKAKIPEMIEINNRRNGTVNELSEKADELTERSIEVAKEISSLKLAINKLAEVNSELCRKYSERDNLVRSMIPVHETAYTEIELQNINEKINKLTDNLSKVLANRKYTELQDKLLSDKFNIEQTISALKIWDKLTSANGLQSRMMNEPFIKFVDCLNRYIKPFFGESVSAKFNLIEKANSFNFGIERNNKYIPYDLLSSGEKCMYMLAMMVCIVCESRSELNLIMIDDLFDHLDDENINKLIASLNSIEDIQFILAGVKPINDSNYVIEVN